MMFAKARIFGDQESMERIASCKRPADAQRLGRKVTPYADEPWAAQRYFHVFRCNVAKFEQHAAPRRVPARDGRSRARRSVPRDRIWGIGLAEDHVDATDPERWRGLNLLGFVLMDVRDTLG